MATRNEYTAAAKALGEIAKEYLDHIPQVFLRHVDMDEVDNVINKAAIAAVDAAEKARPGVAI